MPRIPAWVLVCFSTLSLPAIAQDARPRRAAPRERAIEPETTTLTVRGIATRARSATEYVIPLGALSQLPRSNGGELLTLLPGVSLSNDSGEGHAHSVALRGFAGEDGRDIAFSVEGIPLNDESNPEGQGYTDLYAIFPEIVSRIDLTQGVSDPRQGNFAIAGSVDYRLGVRPRGFLARVGVGTFGQERLTLIAAPRSEPESTFVALDVAHGDGFGSSRASDRVSGVGQYAFSLHGGITGRLTAMLYSGRWDAAGVIREDDFAAGRIGFFDTYRAAGALGGRSSRALLSASLEYLHANDKAELRLWTSARDYALRENFTGFAEHPSSGDMTGFLYRGVSLGALGFYRRTFTLLARRHEIELGWNLRHDRYATSATQLDVVSRAPLVPADPENVAADARVSTLGAYLDLTARIIDRVTLRAGARFDVLVFDVSGRSFDDASGQFVMTARSIAAVHAAPKLTLEFDLGRGFALLASHGGGFRSPNALDVLSTGDATPATVTGQELGLRFALPRGVSSTARASASLAAFHTLVDHDLVFDPIAGRAVSVGATRRIGGVFWARIQPIPFVDVNASVTYTYARAEADALGGMIRAGEQLPYLPAAVARLDSSLDMPIASMGTLPVRLRGGLGAGVRGPVTLRLSPATSPVLLLDAMLGMRVGPVIVDVSARNLLDQRWRDALFEYSSSFQPGASAGPAALHFTAGAPRTVWVSVSVLL